MLTLEHEGQALRYVDRGSGTPVVFVHNGALDHRLWDHQLRRFERDRRVVAPDLLGHGRSDRPAAPCTADGLVAQVEHLADHLELDRFHLVGCCVGGSVALKLALRHPSRVLSVTAITAVTPSTLSSGLFGRPDALAPPGSRARALAERAGETRLGRWAMTRAFLRLQCGRAALADASFSDHVRELYRGEGEWRVFFAADYSGFAELDALDGPAGLPPAMLMWGGRNRILPADAGRALAARLRPERAEFWDDCGYMLMRERPEETNRALAEFFAAGETARTPDPGAAAEPAAITR